jgi:hypothetical protein
MKPAMVRARNDRRYYAGSFKSILSAILRGLYNYLLPLLKTWSMTITSRIGEMSRPMLN